MGAEIPLASTGLRRLKRDVPMRIADAIHKGGCGALMFGTLFLTGVATYKILRDSIDPEPQEIKDLFQQEFTRKSG